VEIDCCENCGGIWLDKGKVFLFVRGAHVLARELDVAIKKGKPTQKLSPRTNKPMVEISLFNGSLSIDFCPESEGLWLDGGKLDRLRQLGVKDLKIDAGKMHKKNSDFAGQIKD
jgi:Zn-finger nucleic acid-binding protein